MDSRRALTFESLHPPLSRFWMHFRVKLDEGLPENSKIMNFSQEVLRLLQAVFPILMQLGEEILHHIPELFHGDAQLVQTSVIACLHGPRVQSAGRSQLLQSKSLKNLRIDTRPRSPPRQRATPLLPLL